MASSREPPSTTPRTPRQPPPPLPKAAEPPLPKAAAPQQAHYPEPLARHYVVDDAPNIFSVLPSRGFDRVNEVRSGLPYSQLEWVQSAVALSAAETARALGIPERTLARRKQDGRLSAEESDRLDRVTRVLELGRRVLGGEAKIRTWLHASNRALGGVVPLELLDTDRGVRAVEDVLLRIEHGMYG